MRRVLTVLWAVAGSGLLLASGCQTGPDDQGGPNTLEPREKRPTDAGAPADAGPTVTLESLEDDFFAAYCAWLKRCHAVDSEETCRKLVADMNAGLSPFYALEQAVKHGRASFDSAAAAACVSALRSSSACVFEGASVPGCDAFQRFFLTGLTADGDPCYGSNECAPTSYCTLDSSAGTCPGVCTPRFAAATPVADSVQCLEGLYRYNGVCTARVAREGSCAPTGGSSDRQSCASGDFCDSTDTCVAYKAVGESCAAEPTACGLLSYCDGGQCTAFEAPGTACNPSGATICQADLTCLEAFADGGSPTCRRLAATNGCKADQDCGAGFHCSGYSAGVTLGNCIAKGNVGVGCTTASQCKSGLFCDSSGKCAAPAALGEACDPAPQGGGSCVALPGVGCADAGSGSATCAHTFGCFDHAP